MRWVMGGSAPRKLHSCRTPVKRRGRARHDEQFAAITRHLTALTRRLDGLNEHMDERVREVLGQTDGFPRQATSRAAGAGSS